MVLDSALSDLRCEQWAETVSPEPHRLVADTDTALEQQVLDLAQRQRVPNIHHHREADGFGRTIEITEGVFIVGDYGMARPGSSRFSLTKPALGLPSALSLGLSGM